MTAKQFFKSSGFLSVVVLLCIAIISSFLLTVLHYLWPAKQQTIDIAKVEEMYDNKNASFEEVAVDENYATNSTYGTMNGIAKASDTGYVFLTTGKGGYSSGTVTMYTAIRDGEIVAIAFDAQTNQSYWEDKNVASVIPNYVGKEISQNIDLTDDIKATGATFSSTALNNSVNMAAWYAREVLQLGENVDGKSQEAIKALEGYQDSEIKSLDATAFDKTLLAVDGASFMLAYSVNGTQEAYTYKVGDNYVAYIVDGTTRQVVAKTEGVDTTIDTAICSAVAKLNIYSEVVSDVVLIIDGTSYQYSLTAKSVASGTPEDCKILVTVDTVEGKIVVTDFVMVYDGTTDDWQDNTIWNGDDTVFDGKGESDLSGINVSTGSTNSNKTIIRALQFCLKDYAISNNVAGYENPYSVNAMYDVEGVTFEFVDASKAEYSKGTIYTVVKASDGGMIVVSEGTGGYPEGAGTVKILTVVNSDKTIKSIKALAYENQTLWGDIEANVLKNYVGQSVTNNLALDDFKVTGATESSTALNNAVNAVVYANQNYNK